jgi:4-hydroxy-3-polyprenylbenzoate decarboxylase
VPIGRADAKDGKESGCREVARREAPAGAQKIERSSSPSPSEVGRSQRLTTRANDLAYRKKFCGTDRLAPVRDREIVVGVAGASGGLLARRFVERSLAAPELSILHLVVSEPALQVARDELDSAIRSGEDWVAALSTSRGLSKRIRLHSNAQIDASIASGSYATAGMIVVPCSAGTLGSIANGISRDLLQRAADVCLKERRPLVLAFRESPYSLIHIENMRRAALAGAIIAPPSPAFYVESPSVDRFLDAYCIRAARWLGLTIPGEDFGWKGGPSSTRQRPRRRK